MDKPLALSYGFIMDDVESVKNLTAIQDTRVFILYPDPHFYPFDDGIRSVFQIKKHDNLLTVNVSIIGISYLNIMTILFNYGCENLPTYKYSSV